MLRKIVSGGQSGVDLAGLCAGQFLGLEVGGFAPVGWLTEDGPAKELMESFGLVECMRPGYAARTEANVQTSDATVIFTPTDKLTPGTYVTFCCCLSMEKPVLIVDASISDDEHGGRPLMLRVLRDWLEEHEVDVLNVAGPRASKWVDGQSLVMGWLVEALGGGE